MGRGIFLRWDAGYEYDGETGICPISTKSGIRDRKAT